MPEQLLRSSAGTGGAFFVSNEKYFLETFHLIFPASAGDARQKQPQADKQPANVTTKGLIRKQKPIMEALTKWVLTHTIKSDIFVLVKRFDHLLALVF